MQNGFHPKSNVDWFWLSRSEGGRGLIGVHDIVETAILGLRNYVRNIKEIMLIVAHTIKKDEDREHQMSTKSGKRIKGKHSGHKNTSMVNLSSTWRVKQVKMGGDG